MTQFAVAYKMEVYAPRSEQPDPTSETTLLYPRPAALHSDAFIVSTLPSTSEFKGYMMPPRGRKSSLDVSQRTSDTGSMSVELLDKRLGAVNSERWFAQYFSSVSGESRLHNCLTIFYESTDGGCNWDVYFTGRIKTVKRTSRLTWELTVRDMVEDWKRDIFVGRAATSVTIDTSPTTTRYVQLSTLQPHHNIKQYHNISARPELPGAIFATNIITSVGAAPSDRWRIVSKTLMERASNIKNINAQVFQFTTLSFRANSVRVRATNTSTLATGVFNLRQASCYNDKFHAVADRYAVEALPVGEEGYATFASLGAVGAPLTFYLYSHGALGGQSALLIHDVHPVQFLADLCDGKFGPLGVDGTPLYTIRRNPFATVWSTMLADTSWGTVSYIIDKQDSFEKWVPENLCLPHGLAIVADASGYLVPKDMRSQVYLSLPTITDDDLAVGAQQDEGQSQDASDAVNVVDVMYYGDVLQTDFIPSRDQTDYPDSKPGLILSVEHTLRDPGSETNLIDMGFRLKKIKATGLRYSPDYVSVGNIANAAVAEAKADALAVAYLAEYARGSREIILRCRRTAVVLATTIGDVRFLQCSTLLNPDTLLYDGTILARCVQRTEQEEIIELTFHVGGVSLQASLPGGIGTPTLTGYDTTGATISVAVTLNGAGDPAEVQVAITDQTVVVAPGATDPLWQTVGVVTYNGTFYYGGFPLGMRLWVRARSNPSLAAGGSFKQPSDWVYPVGVGYVDTVGLVAPSVSYSNLTGTTVRIFWTGGDVGQSIDILLRAGLTGGSWLASEIYVTTTQPPYEFIIGNLINLHPYTVGVRFIDAAGNPGPVGEVSFTTTGFTTTAPRVAGMQIDHNSSIAFHVFSADPNYDIEINRAPDFGSAPDIPNSVYYLIPRTGDYYDYLPPDGTLYWYRARHRLDSAGILPGPWIDFLPAYARPTSTGGGSGPVPPPLGNISPGNPSGIFAPTLPTVVLSQVASAGTATLTLALTDPQLRVTSIEFQTYDGTTTSAWVVDTTIPYSATVTYTATAISIIRYRVIGYDADSNAGQTLISGEAYFGGPLVLHHGTHENGGSDEINVAGLSGLLADPQVPLAHHTTHENGGGDEIDVTGLSGLLADPQTPLTHYHTFSSPLPVVIDGGGSVLSTGDYLDVTIPFTGTISEWVLLGNDAGDIVLDTYRCTYAQFDNVTHPVAADSIWGTKPSLVTAHKNTATGLSIAVTAGDILRVHVDSATILTRATLSFTITRAV